jgi:hypothetical protein
VTVEGEANTFQMATDFTNALSGSEALRGIQWEAGTPTPDSNNVWRFTNAGALPPPL